MSYSFKTYPANSTFGVYKEPLESGEYIQNKKATTTFCSANKCHPNKSLNTQENLSLLKKSNYLKYYNCNGFFNKSNLNINLLTTLNLAGVNVNQNTLSGPPIQIITPAIINSYFNPYMNYSIDPNGSLFGNMFCAKNNYQYYLQLNSQ
jgi:hypothetical protein